MFYEVDSCFELNAVECIFSFGHFIHFVSLLLKMGFVTTVSDVTKILRP